MGSALECLKLVIDKPHQHLKFVPAKYSLLDLFISYYLSPFSYGFPAALGPTDLPEKTTKAITVNT